MATDVLLVTGAPARRRPGRMTRSERRAEGQRETVAMLGADGAQVLETLTQDGALMSGLPVLMGWRPQGSDHELHGADLDDLLADLDRLTVRLVTHPGLPTGAGATVAELASLARRAAAEDLTLVVSPD